MAAAQIARRREQLGNPCQIAVLFRLTVWKPPSRITQSARSQLTPHGRKTPTTRANGILERLPLRAVYGAEQGRRVELGCRQVMAEIYW